MLDHRRRREKATIDEFGDVALAHEPDEIALHAGNLRAVVEGKHRLGRSWRAFRSEDLRELQRIGQWPKDFA